MENLHVKKIIFLLQFDYKLIIHIDYLFLQFDVTRKQAIYSHFIGFHLFKADFLDFLCIIEVL